MGLESEDFGRAMARKHRFRFGFPDVFAGRLRIVQGRRWLIANSFRCGRRDQRAQQGVVRDRNVASVRVA